ncbi:GTP-binding protein YPT52 [Candida viswanathii]|uniref:GTP-binding protein YPT52 n=1 Tax=Candida viswanathii TaxID=5486 RepID=A0A367XS93_9ASCO|nr:GTP-binding protein YPT52 [Candida viswanathii]
MSAHEASNSRRSSFASAPAPPFKIVVLGDSSVGKTSLVHRFTTNKFDLHTSNTIGAAFITKVFSPFENQEHKVKLEIWDTAGQERYRSLTPMYYRNAKAALVCFDLSNFESSFSTAKYWILQLELNNTGDANDRIEIRLVGTKLDLAPNKRIEIQDQLDELIQEQPNVKQYHETSSKEGTGVVELFNQIVKDIDEEFFTKYYELIKNTPHDQIGNMLSTRASSISNCC